MNVLSTQDIFGEEQWNRPAINLTMVTEINKNRKNGWVAGVNGRFAKMTLAGVRVQLGAVVDPKHTYKLPERRYTAAEQAGAPASLDVRKQWFVVSLFVGRKNIHENNRPACASVSGDIRNQSKLLG